MMISYKKTDILESYLLLKRAKNRLEMQYLHLLQGYWYFDVGEEGLFVTFLKFEKSNNKSQEYFSKTEPSFVFGNRQAFGLHRLN